MRLLHGGDKRRIGAGVGARVESLEPRVLLASTSALSAFSSHPGADTSVVADINHDGRPDTVTPTEFGFQVRYKRPSGLEAVFDVPVAGVDGLFGPSPLKVEHIAVGHFDGDARLDIAISVRDASGAIAWGEPGRIEVYSSRVGGVFVLIGSVPAKGVTAIDAGDFDAGGRDELIVERVLNTANTPTRFEVRRYVLGNGAVRSGGVLFRWTGVITRPIVADVDGDGKTDVLLGVRAGAYLGDANVQLFRGQGDGTFAQTELYRFASHTALEGLSIGDVNGDGRTDVAIVSWDGHVNTLSYLAATSSGGFLSPTARVVIGDLDAALPPASPQVLVDAISLWSFSNISDADHDGHPEIRVQVSRTTNDTPHDRPSYSFSLYAVTYESDGAGGFTVAAVG
jgi:hypothetical protein